MVRPTAGQARVFGLAADDVTASVEIRGRTAFVSEDKDLYAGMTVGELVRFTSPFYPKWRTDRASEYLARSSFEPTPQSSISHAACAPSSRCCLRLRRAPSC